MNYIKNERGIALIVAIIGLVMGVSLLAALATLSVLDHREANNTRRMGQAFAAAEHGLGETAGNWNSSSLNMLAVNDSVSVSGTTPHGSGEYTGTVRRLNDEMFLVDIRASDSANGARQRLGAFVKLQMIDVTINAALTIGGPTRIGGNAQVSGIDEAPSPWSGCSADSSVAGMTVSDSSDLETVGRCSGASCIDGEPPVEVDPTVEDSTFFKYGDLDWDALASLATKVLVPGTYTGVAPSFTVDAQCKTSDITNWGDPLVPTSACGGYFPIIYSPGDLTINGNYGQGMLLVDGNLFVQGGFQFFGVVIVRQSLETTGTGGHFNGAVLAASVDLDRNNIFGDAVVRYSSCAKERVLTSAAPASLLRSRGWLYTY